MRASKVVEGEAIFFLLQRIHCLLRAETLSAINHLSSFSSGRIEQMYHLLLCLGLFLNSDHSISRSLECSAHVSRFVCLLAYVKVKVLFIHVG